EHLDTIPATESDEVIKSSVEDLVPIPSEFEGIPDTMCDVHLDNNHTPLEAKDHLEIVLNSNDDISSSDDDSLLEENMEYVEASPHDSELVSLEAAEIVIREVEEIEDDNLHEKLLNVHLLIANIEALKDNPTQSFELLTKSSSTSLNSFLEETNTFLNSLSEFENFYFDLGEISGGSTTTHSDISLPDYEAFYFDDDHIKEIGSGSTTTHSDIFLSEYDSFIFAHKEFVDELTHIISPPEYDRFYFKDLPDPGELMSVLNSGIRENLSTTSVNLPIEDDHSPLLTYVVWIFVSYLTYLVIPLYLHPFGNEDTIFDPCITINHFYSFKPGSSHRHGAFKKFNTHREISSGSTTTHSDISLPDYEAFYFDNDHVKEISSGSPTTQSNISLSEYDSFIFDLTHEEFVDELTHIISLLEYDYFYYCNIPDPGELRFVLNSGIRENLPYATSVNLPIEDDQSPLLAYVVWIFLAYLTYPVIPPYLHPFRNEDTIFDTGITINHFYSFKPGSSHRHGAFKKFNTHCSHLNEWPMIIKGKNTPLLDVLLFHFYPF
nr:hypothetical protein [Tanacetum cinerariifolium]